MRAKSVILIVLLAGVGASLFAQTGQVSRGITVSDNAGKWKVLTFGLDSSATDGIDPSLGEAQLPPLPPSGAFDARLVGEDIDIPLGQGSWIDYRQGSSSSSGIRVHEIKYQTGSGSTITVAWDLPTWATGRLQDVITGSLIDVAMMGTGTYTVANPSAFSKLKMSITYDFPLPIQLASFHAAQTGSHRVLLEWITLSEVNNYGFFLQRRPDNDPVFTEVPNSFVQGHGTTNDPQHYEYTDDAVPSGSWFYRLKQVDLDGTVNLSDPVHVDVLTGVEELVPTDFALLQNYPNPFNPSTTIRYALPQALHVTLVVYDALGQQVAELVNEQEQAGYHDVVFKGSQLDSGVYFYHIRAGEYTASAKLLLLK